MIDINPASKEDISQLCDIEEMCFAPCWSIAQLEAELESEDAFFAAAKTAGRIAGFCILHMAGDQGELYQIAVHPDFRCSGIATALLKRSFEWLEEKRAESVFLEVRSGNDPAIRLYEKNGFSRLGTRKKYYTQPVEDAVVMVRKVEMR